MFSRFSASCSAIGATRDRHRISVLTVVVAIGAAALAGCQPMTSRLAGVDPADPSVPVRGVAYSSATAPYTSTRPSAPAPWKARNDAVAPGAKDEGGAR
ncbi:hypothetical protein [Bradyrhizobium sp. AS23.2]|uniref:hypothetical protein n=1 Tax=Bradyrhizobium sp. AS23.2 TaxID=1680155 RepID=UPI00093FC4D0|nr:hypothetical protein [Bradyrhizobium sp. AS23.2]OKO75249.1 hypothetical protein AC630_25070 [Bradyrhizobium sp. AS23.2]